MYFNFLVWYNDIDGYRLKHNKYGRLWRIKNRDRWLELSKRYNKKLKLDVLNAYSNRKLECKCCGESQIEFLTLDHLLNNGASDRRLRGGSKSVYVYLRLNNFPSGYQVLCYNCNCAKAYYKKCPHKNNEKNANKT